MTVGIAALADGRTRIVLVTDKQFTGEYKIQIEDSPKMLFLPNGWVAAYCGDPTFALETGDRAAPLLRGVTDARVAADKLHEALLAQWEHSVTRDVLRPQFLDARSYRQSDAETRATMDDKIDTYREGACDFLLCGFDEAGTARVFKVGLDDHTEELGFAAIGSGARIAEFRLAWRKTRLTDALPRVVYEVYEAKRHAELDPYVGELMDFWVLFDKVGFRQQTDGTLALVGMSLITPDTQRFLRGVFSYFDQTPFKRSVRKDEVKVAAPDKDWEADLDERLQGVLGQATVSSSETAQPSSQSQNDASQRGSPPVPSHPSNPRADQEPRRRDSSRPSRRRRS